MEGRRAEIVDYDEIRNSVDVAYTAGDLAKVKVTLERLLERDDTTRSASENLFVYRTLGGLYEEIGAAEESAQAYVRAYDYDARDRQTLEALARVALEAEAFEDAYPIFTRLLVHHRYDLRGSFVARVYRAISAYHQAQGDLDRAQSSLEKALEVRPGDMDIINALLGVAEESGDDEAVLAVREKLLTTLTNAESRAAVLVAIGDDYLNKLDDAVRAIDAYERALAECATSQPALLRVADLSVRQEDWQRAVRSLSTLGEVVDEPEAQVNYLTKAATIFRDRLGEHSRAIQTYNKILDIAPGELDSFKAVARILLEMEDWAGLEANYVRMIERHTSQAAPQANVLVVLYRNLGELRLSKLDDPRGAAEAYQAASDLVPDELSYHQTLGELYARFDDTLPRALEQQRAILRLAPDKLEAVDALAGVYRRLERFDESLCVFRVLEALGRADDEGNRIVERYSTHRAPKIDAVFDEDIWKAFLRPEYLEVRLARLLQLAQPALVERFAHDLEFYGLREKDSRFDLSEPSFFSRTYQSIARTLNVGPVPAVYVNPNQRGIRNAYLWPSAFILGQDLLAGREEREIAFACAKALTLFRPEFFLAQFGGSKVIEPLIYTVFKTFRPELNIELNKNMQRISKDLEKKLKPEEQKALKTLVDELIESSASVNIKLYVEAAEDTANRVGLVFCDDPKTVQRMLNEEESPLGSRGVPERFGSLLMWGIGDQYMELRKRIGLSIA